MHPYRKQPSGHQNRIKTAEKARYQKQIEGSLLPFCKATVQHIPSNEPHNVQPVINEESLDDHMLVDNEESILSPSSSSTVLEIVEVISHSEEPIHESLIPSSITSENHSVFFNLFDPAEWPTTLTQTQIQMIVQKEPKQYLSMPDGSKFPKVGNQRFTENHYYKVVSAHEKYKRDWLVYSIKVHKVYCFACKLFSTLNTLLINGCNDFQHISKKLHEHETSEAHLQSVLLWKELSKRLKTNQTIDSHLISLRQKKVLKLTKIYECMGDAILYLTEHNMGFRGGSDKLYTKGNGNFLGFLQRLAKYVPELDDHLKYAHQHPNSTSHLSHNFQNYLRYLLAERVADTIKDEVNASVFYGISADSTVDISKKDQLSLIVRYVVLKNNRFEIVERFLGFVEIERAFAEVIFEKIIGLLEKRGIAPENCRYQCYDNAKNMSGVKGGVQALFIKHKSSTALFTGCCPHTLNLCLNDLNKFDEIKWFFSTLNELYAVFAASVLRWNIWTSIVHGFTPKPIQNTRWDERFKSNEALVTQFFEVIEAVDTLIDDPVGQKVIKQTKLLRSKLCNPGFITLSFVMHDVLENFRAVSKLLQTEGLEMKTAHDSIQGLKDYLLGLKSSRCKDLFEESNNVIDSLNLSENYKLNSTFNNQVWFDLCEDEDSDVIEIDENNVTRKSERSIRPNFNDDFYYGDIEFSDESSSSSIQLNKENVMEQDGEWTKEDFESFLLKVLDNLIESINTRFKPLESILSRYLFLFNPGKIKNMSAVELKSDCLQLGKFLENDIDGEMLYKELLLIKNLLPEKGGALDCLNVITDNNLEDTYTNSLKAFKIACVVHTSVAKNERSNSKLKLIKSYARSTLGQESFNDCALLAIESVVADKIDFNDIYKKLAEQNVTKFPSEWI